VRHSPTRSVAWADHWAHESLCAGWTVKDVAAHVISNPQIRLRDVAAMSARNVGRSYNTMVYRSVKQWSESRTPADVLAEFETYAGSTRHVPVTTTVEPLLDVLVHSQDILRPLGLRHDMPPDAAAVAADRARLHGVLMGWRSARKLRLVATDIGWVRGKGPTIEGPMQELLMICTGRAPYPSLISGDGAEPVVTRDRRTSMSPSRPRRPP
jgi:uncharacterized protein (TIGR03083 family)